MKLTPLQEMYAIKLAHVRREAKHEYDENGIDVSLIRENLRRTPVERLRRGNLYSQLLFELISNRRDRLESCSLTREITAILDDYSLAKEAGDIDRTELLRWFADQLTPRLTSDGAIYFDRCASAIYSVAPYAEHKR
jgi:hypothetical protein